MKAPYVLEYAYKRSTGPVVGAFLTALRAGRLLGGTTADGRVICPPAEYDPRDGAGIDESVEVGQAGVVTTWSWVYEPRDKHPLSRPFAWALVKLDGADTALLHTVDAGSIERMETGMRVRVRWASERVGRIEDIACFVPEEAP